MASIEKLRSTFQEVMRSPHSSFYRDLYAGRTFDDGFPRSWDEWEQLPFLSKQDIQRVPFRERLFVPYMELARMHQTSGTTGAGITILPRVDVPYHDAIAPHFSPRAYMGFMYPHSGYDMFTAPGTRFISGDSARLETSAHLAARTEVDGIAAASASFLIQFAPALSATYDCARIKHILLQSDVCTNLQRAALKHRYPNAAITMIYLCAEMQGVAALPPTPRIEAEPFALITSEDVHAELVDGNGTVIHALGIEGELVISMLRMPSALPLLRYRPGDRAVFLETRGTENVFKVLGRTANDRIRLSAGQIILAEIERAIEEVAPPGTTDFRATLKETGETPLPFLTIELCGDAVFDTERIARSLEQSIMIAPQRSYADGIARAMCGPIQCVGVTEFTSAGKPQRLIDARIR